MEAVESRPNVELRHDENGQRIVVLGFPYDVGIVDAVRRIPGRRFDWDAREWFAPAEDWVGVHVADILTRALRREGVAERSHDPHRVTVYNREVQIGVSGRVRRDGGQPAVQIPGRDPA